MTEDTGNSASAREYNTIIYLSFCRRFRLKDVEVSTPSSKVPKIHSVKSVVEPFLRFHLLCHVKKPILNLQSIQVQVVIIITSLIILVIYYWERCLGSISN